MYSTEGDLEVPGRFRSEGSAKADVFTEGDNTWTLQRHVSFVDCPGHDILMATMLNGAAVMDAAMLLIAGNESCPQPQTSEHLAAVEIMRLKNIIILQNKVDLVKPDQAEAQHDQIKKFVAGLSPVICHRSVIALSHLSLSLTLFLTLSLSLTLSLTLSLSLPLTLTISSSAGTVAENAPIIPLSAVLRFNIDIVCEYIARHLPVPSRNFAGVPRLIVIRSFDVNKPGEDVQSLKGGVAGGSILQGVLRVGDEIEVRPGIVNKDAEGNMTCAPIFSRIISMYAEQNDLMYAVPGGLIGVGTKIDPTLTRADRLVGQVLGLKGHLPEVFTEVEISYYLLRRLLGVKTQDGAKQAKVRVYVLII